MEKYGEICGEIWTSYTVYRLKLNTVDLMVNETKLIKEVQKLKVS